ncbi:Ldh family oxidoreductase [Sulfurisphaera ohwakuensis]|uniref:LDH2 family malate/lactate/ureidoglycolate dehydrogenase n=1 Tax=Sulfurisphaera ohwakuensis TaxID=69656 RepID=A0A650CIT6_SULOH|nr:Ldh family oxidoreductase [Sulfurisphaera ohwakuensis]MBB5253407.1 LDH2 family malate/lactate/ureidoglycolate dehydrogenase [Sulfurisphaera ohwakuensis]QGR17722.1 Ldh family oxidoreductase [Sulfurisphaera ohwakuensis]
MKIKVKEAENLVESILKKRGVENPSIIAKHFVEAELRGHSSHGLQRVIPLVKGIDLGTIRKTVKLTEIKREDNAVLYDANYSIGILVWHYLTESPKETLIAVRNSSHIGFLGYYTRRIAMRLGKPAIMIGNAEPAVVKPGTAKKVISTTPISIAIPCEKIVVLDMSLSPIARGKIIEAKRKGEKIPYGVAVNKDGKITTDPDEALQGGLLPIGGMKGFFLMITLELLVSFLTGSALATEVQGVLDTTKSPNKGEFMIILPKLQGDCHGLSVLKQFVEYLPGEHSDEMLKRDEIDIDEKLYNIFVKLEAEEQFNWTYNE